MSEGREHAPAQRPVTDPHTLSRALRAWAGVIDDISDLVFMHDEDGYLMRVNRAYAARTGTPANQLLGRPFRDAWPWRTSDDRLAGIGPGPCAPGEIELSLSGGQAFSCRTLPMQDDTGATICCIHILHAREPAIESWQDADSRLRRNLEATIEAFAASIELSDPDNSSHGRRVASLALAIGRNLPMSAARLEGTRLAALIHDLGSFKIPIEVLVKPGKLSAVERLLVQSHPEVAHRILHGIDFPWPIAEIILQHHERIDGTGYPRGLAGPDLLDEAKILAVADAMEAMLSDRPYRPRLGIEAALRELTRHRGTFYDPAVVDACVRVFEQGFELPG